MRIISDSRTNTLIAVGPPERVKQVEGWALELDSADAHRTPSARELRYYTLKNADARLLGKTVFQTLQAMAVEVPIISDPATDTLIAIGTKEQQDMVAGIIAKLDLPAKNRAAETESEPGEKKETASAPKK